jgi:hypothetical protein
VCAPMGEKTASLRQGFKGEKRVFLMHLVTAYTDIGFCVVCRWPTVTMAVRWRERDWSQLRYAVANGGPEVRATLATCGLLKFFECPLIQTQEYLLQFLL